MSVDKYTKHIAEASYKNVIKNKSNTDNNLAWFEEPETVSPKVDAKSIWLDSEFIPTSPEGLIWRGDLYYAAIGGSSVPVVEKFTHIKVDKVNDRAVFFSEKLIDVIQDEEWHLTIEDANGDVIPFGLKKWTIDIGVGYLSFTDGMPEYDMPFYITGYRYCGRKLPEHMITTDGRQEMLPDYTPEKDQQVATKQYVDQELSKIGVDVNKMLPPEPATFEDKDLTFICDKEFDATDIKTNEHYDHVILDDYEFTIDVPEFYNPGYGTVKLLVSINGVWQEVGRIELDLNSPVAQNLTIDYAGEAYPDSLSARGFFKKIKCHFTSSLREMSGVISSHIYPMIFKMSYTYNSTIFFSNELIVCEELQQDKDTLLNERIVLSTQPSTFGYRYVSGILTPRAGDIITASHLNYRTLKKFTKGTHISKMSAFGLDYERFPELTYDAYNPPLEIKEDLVIPEGIYQEVTTIDAETYNVFDEVSGEHHADYNFRIDTISDESRRVYSGEVQDQMIVNSCGEWDPQTDLRNYNELQMLAGKYQWPEKDFSINGTGYITSGVFSDVSWIKTGLNYSECPKMGKRYVTLKYDMKIANGIFINFEDAENITQDKDTKAFNVDSMYIKVLGSTDWLDAKEPYDGIGINDKWMQGCLAVQDSKEGKIYCTFGPKPIEGILYIRIGVRYDQHIKFRDITIKENI